MTATIRRHSDHPPLGARTAARNEDFFDESQLAELRAYSRPRKRVDLAAKLVVGAVDLLLIFGLDLGPEIADRVGASPWPVRLVVVASAFALFSQLLLLPAEWCATMVHD